MSSRRRVDDTVMWSALAVYAAVWALLPTWMLGTHLWFLGVCWAGVYVLAHVREIRTAGHCYMSADSTAVPSVLVAVGASYVLTLVLGMHPQSAPLGLDALAFLMAAGGALMVGHIAALLFAAIATAVLSLV